MKLMPYLLSSLILLSTSVSANLIQNGSFESLNANQTNLALGISGNPIVDMSGLEQAGDWGLFETVSNWTTISGVGVELQYSETVVSAQDGNIYMEMDTNPGFYQDPDPILGFSNAVISQEISRLIIGNEYQLSFWTQGRTSDIDENGLDIFWYAGSDRNTGIKQSIKQVANPTGEWNEYVYRFLATDTTMNVAFAGTGKGTGKGAFLDNISLTGAISEIPEPNVLLLMLSSFFILSLRKKI